MDVRQLVLASVVNVTIRHDTGHIQDIYIFECQALTVADSSKKQQVEIRQVQIIGLHVQGQVGSVSLHFESSSKENHNIFHNNISLKVVHALDLECSELT